MCVYKNDVGDKKRDKGRTIVTYDKQRCSRRQSLLSLENQLSKKVYYKNCGLVSYH